MDLEIITLSEIWQKKTNIIWYHLHVKFKKIKIKMNLYTKQKQIHRRTTNSWLTNGKVGKDKLGVWINIHTLCACMLSHLVMSDSFWFHGLKPTRLLCPWTGMSCHFLLQGIFLTQGLNPRLLSLLHWQVGFSPLAPPGKPFSGLTVEGSLSVKLTSQDTSKLLLPSSFSSWAKDAS